MTELTETAKAFALGVIRIGAVKFGEFRLKLHETQPNAPLSPFYIDLRILRSFPETLETAVHLYGQLASTVRYDLLADVPTAATPAVAILSFISKVPMISPRLEAKTHGLTNRIDGVYREGQKVLLIDDLITTAESKLEAIGVLEAKGLQVSDVIVLVDRQQGGVDALTKRGYRCHAGLKVKDLFTFYLENGLLEHAAFERAFNYVG